MKTATAARLVLATGFVVLLFNSGGRFAMGLLLKPMADDLGWSRSAPALAVTVFMVVSAAALPFVGGLVDRFGARSVLGTAVVVSGIAVALTGLVQTPLQMVLVYGLLFALGSAGTSITPIGVMLARWFPERVGMANSIAISGMGVGQLVVISALAAELPALGWRGSFAALGAATLAVVLPLVALVGRAAQGAPAGAPAGEAPAAPGQSFAAVARSPRLWLLLGIYAICGFQDFLVATHVVAFALDEGVEPLLAGNMLAFMGLAGLAGVLATGALSDRRGPVLPTAICFVVRLAIFALVLHSRDASIIVAVALLYGMTFWITAPLTVVFARQAAAAHLLGTVSGLITMVHHAAGGLGAYVGAAVFDRSGSYEAAFAIMLAGSALALALTFALRR